MPDPLRRNAGKIQEKLGLNMVTKSIFSKHMAPVNSDYPCYCLKNLISRKTPMKKHRIYTTSFASVYPHYIKKAEKKGRTKEEVDEIVRWLTGYSQDAFEAVLENKTDFETFFAEAPEMNPSRSLIKGVVCGIRVENIEEPVMREIRYLDKLIDELARGKAMEKILRK